MTTTISETPTGFPNRRLCEAEDANQLSKKELRQLVEVLRLRDEAFFVIELRSPLRDDIKTLLASLHTSGASDWSIGWIERHRLGIIGENSEIAMSVQRWFSKNQSAAQSLHFFFHDGGRRNRKSKQEHDRLRHLPGQSRGPYSYFADNASLPHPATSRRQRKRAKSLSEKGSDPLRRGQKRNESDSPPKGQTPFRIGSNGISGNGQPVPRDMFCLGKNIQPVYDLYKIRTPIGKRCFDIALAVLALALATPLLCLSAALIKLTSGGPLFFVQDRVGHGGQPFRMFKFRTMRTDADNSKRHLSGQNEMNGSAFKMRRDPRVTWVGIWLRRLSIDEIPQLWNVIRGDMSLVGPRPLPLIDWTPGSARELHRHDVVPGLTCIWQIRGRNEIAWDEWVRMDLFYVRKRCWSLDAKILLATIPAVLSQRGAY